MPHPAAVEQLAEAVAAAGAELDDTLARYILEGGSLPVVDRWLARIRGDVEAAVRAAFVDIDPTATTDLEVGLEADRIMDELRVVANRAIRDADQRRSDVEATPDPDDDDDGGASVAVLAAAGAGIGALVAASRATSGRLRRGRNRDVRRLELRKLAAASGSPMPRSVGPMSRQIVRTRVAEGRNRFAARLAESAGLVVLIQDARFGPTDKPCEDVNGKYATPQWLRRHPSEHPNCTRRGRPVRLPAGRHVTLLE